MAIAYDNATRNLPATGSSVTFSHTVTGSNTCLVLFSNVQANLTLTATYAGVSMSLVYKQTTGIGNLYQHCFILAGAATGANNVVISGGTAGTVWSAQMALSYTGCKQTSQPDSFNSGNFTGTGNKTVSTTVVASNCWTVYGVFPTNNDPDTVVTQNNQQRLNGNGNAGDSNATVSTGSIAGGWHWALTDDNAMGVVSIAPFVASGPTNMKSFDGNTKSNIKSIDGNLIANIKSFDGNS